MLLQSITNYNQLQITINYNYNQLQIIINYKLHIMKQITKFTIALGFIISLASCQSSKSGCYDFGQINSTKVDMDQNRTNSNLVFTKVICKP